MPSEIEEIEIAESRGNELFPIFLKLQNFNTLLVGAGNVGLEKLQAMLVNSPKASITVVGDRVLEDVAALVKDYPQLKIHQRVFQSSDLNNKGLVVLATDNYALHQEIHQLCQARGILINVADTPALCDFYLGAIVQKGDLKLAISTNGKSPTVAKRLKEVLNESIPDEIDDTLQQINKLRNTLSGDFAYKVKRLNEATVLLVKPADKRFKLNLRWLIWSSFVIFTVISIAYFWHIEPPFREYIENISPQFYYFLAAGFVFAMIDGAIGMSYGVTSTSFSLLMGIPPASASMAVHVSEILSNGIAGWMHYQMGNVNKRLFKLLLIPGILGAVIGAFLLSSLEHYSHYTRPAISLYTLILGVVILSKAVRVGKKQHAGKKIKRIGFLGFGGGFIDAVGGGGWGSIVLSSLIAGGRNPRTSLGTVKISRFFIAIMSSLTFITMLGGIHWNAVAGLIIGSALASPIAARVSNRISVKTIMVAVGVVVIIASLNSISKFVFTLL